MCDDREAPTEAKQFASHDDLAKSCQFVATLCLARYRPDRSFAPDPGELTGTVTFLEILGKTYAVTAHHVIEQLDKQAAHHGVLPGSYFLPIHPGFRLGGPFIQAPVDAAAIRPADVALRPIPPELPASIGKRAFVVTEANCAPATITHGQAVGFPTGAKEDTRDNLGVRVAMPCVHAIAEFGSANVDRASFYSPLAEFPENVSLSGMSGGPVFWTDGDEYGLAGIVIESIDAGPDEPIYNVPMVHFSAQRVDYETLLRWAAEADAKWPAARAALNERAKVLQEQYQHATALGVPPPL
ncbi:hypothetical protein L4Z68_001364 [Pseudomonas aeruginosa]|nr:hypothetical protein [Pseudomonas aeruginosa]EKX2969371.1 hypothetical protein [Pseudomonas aeruginosa]HBO6962743.1 hypothetical protein [Pseudomonas aeruginosa]HBO7218652.1 hypothetical protein [Pseudomonas aeruginosa]HBO8004259.1 hypothetical protein [Pseudomonas aeruginosa]